MARQGLPYPFDCLIAGAGYMLAADGKDLGWDERRVAEVEQTLPLRQEDVQFTLTPPRVETPYAVTDLSGGIGYPQQDSDHRNGYEGAYKVDCSGGIPIKGPPVTTQQTLTASNDGAHQFVEFNLVLYVVTGTRLYKRADDTATGWTLISNFAQPIAGRCAVFRGSGGTPYLFIPQGASSNYYVLSTGAVLTQHASQKAEGFEVVNDELWLHLTESNQQVIRKATDGGTAATWGGPTVIGDGMWSIRWMQNVGGRLIVIRDDGLYGPTVQDESVIDRELTPDLRIRAGNNLGNRDCRSVVFNGELFWVHAGSVFRYNPDSGELANVTPSFGNSQFFQGSTMDVITAQPGIAVWGCSTVVIDPLVNGAGSGSGSLMRYGSWSPSGPNEPDQLRQFRPVWHGVVAVFGSGVTAMSYHYLVGTAPRVYALVNGVIMYARLAYTPSPADDSNYGVTGDTGYVNYPRYTLSTPLESKILRRIGVAGWNLSSNRSITPSYRVDTSSAFTDGTAVITDPGTAVPISGTPSSKSFQFRAIIAGSAGTSFARLAGFVVYCAVRSGAYKEIVCQVLTCDNVRDRNGSPTRRSGADLRTALETAIDGNPFTLIAPSGESMTVIGLDYDHKFEGYDSTGVARYRTTLRVVEAA